jgi:uncharacterized membrane protein YphA (DoxX/SURF4 family)
MREYIDKIARIGLSTVWMLAGMGKIIEIESFTRELTAMLFPIVKQLAETSIKTQEIVKTITHWSFEIGFLLSTGELLTAALLLIKQSVKRAAIFSTAMLGVFTILLVINLSGDGSETLNACGCFGALWEEPITWWSVGRNAVLMGISWKVYRAEAEKEV